MPPDFGSPIATSNPVATISSLMGLKQQQQALQSGALGIQQQQQTLNGTGANNAQAAQQTMAERAKFTQMLQSGVDDQGNTIRDAQGNPDPAKILPALGRMAPLTGQQIAQNILATHTAKVGLQTAATALGAQQRQALAGPIQAIATNPGDPALIGQASSAVDQWAKEHPEMEPVAANARLLISHIQSTQDPAQRAKLASSMSALLQPGQQVQTQPTGATVSNGQTTQIGTVAPPTAGGGFTPAGGANSTVQQQPAPSTPVVRSGVPTLYGAQPPLTPGGATPQTDYAPGQKEGVTGPVAVNNEHFARVQQDAAGAANRIAGLNNIREELPNAWSGGGAGGDAVRKVLQNVYSLFGGANASATAQDLIAKNLSQIASQGGATDAARTLTEMGNPGVHVTKDAAMEAVSQLMGVEAKKQAAAAYFSGTATNTPDYANKMTMWTKYADPRAFQYAHLAPDEQAAMKAKLKKTGQWGALNESMSHLAAMGVEP